MSSFWDWGVHRSICVAALVIISFALRGSNRNTNIDWVDFSVSVGICDISAEVKKLTDKPVTAVATHIHWDHIGGHKYFPDFYAHEAELNWLNGGFLLNMETIRGMVIDRCDLPEGYNVSTYEFFQGTLGAMFCERLPILKFSHIHCAFPPFSDQFFAYLCEGNSHYDSSR